MIRLKDTTHQTTGSFLKSAIDVAEYYGFSSLDKMPPAKDAGWIKTALRATPAQKSGQEISIARRDERTLPSVVRKCLLRMPTPGSTLFGWRVAHSTSGYPAASLELHLIGPSSTIVEALLIVVGYAIARQAGMESPTIAINNMGSAESSGRFVRDVGFYLRKHIESISPTLRARAATDPLGTLVQLIERGHPVVPRSPQVMEYLTEEERRRLWELLEYIEACALPYELNNYILGSRDFWKQTLFEIASTDAETGARVPFAFGGRYDPLLSRIARQPVSGAYISISCQSQGSMQIPRVKGIVEGPVMPAIYFAHLGLHAKRESFRILENLRAASIGVHHGLWHDHIGEQMEIARTLATPYIIIMGHKEAVEKSIMVREVATNSQTTIPIEDLVTYLKRRRVRMAERV